MLIPCPRCGRPIRTLERVGEGFLFDLDLDRWVIVVNPGRVTHDDGLDPVLGRCGVPDFDTTARALAARTEVTP